MRQKSLNTVVGYIRKLSSPPGEGEVADAELVRRFVAQRDEAAFMTLIQRHGSLVLGVCRRLLHHEQDAEDAFQATFLVLVRKAASIGKRESVRSWLYGVAYRVAVRARAVATRHAPTGRSIEDVPGRERLDEVLWRDAGAVMEEEIQKLPASCRIAFLLSCREGKTQEAIARELGWPLGTVATRLSRARERLRARLVRRGLGISTALVVLEQARQTATAAPPAACVEAVARMGAKLARDGILAGEFIPANVAVLTKGVLRAMTMTKLKLAAIGVLAMLCVLGLGLSFFRPGALAADEGSGTAPQVTGSTDRPVDRPAVNDGGKGRAIIKVPSERDAIVLFVGTEVKGGEGFPEREIKTFKVGGRMIKHRRLKKGDTVEEGQLLARLDDRMARIEHNIKKARLDSSKADLAGAEALREVYQAEWTRIQELIKVDAKVVSAQEASVAKGQLTKYSQEVASKRADLIVAEAELQRAQLVLEMYEIRSRVRGVIVAIHKHPGEAVKAFGEPIVEVRAAESD